MLDKPINPLLFNNKIPIMFSDNHLITCCIQANKAKHNARSRPPTTLKSFASKDNLKAAHHHVGSFRCN